MKKADKSEHTEAAVVETVDILIKDGIKAGASDVHIEPRENHVIIRYRVDGLLREANKLPHKINGLILAQIKQLAGLNIDEHRTPQDGQFSVDLNDQTYSLRVSTLPTIDGEKVVLRILNESLKPASLIELGFWGEALRSLHHAALQPNGMVLICGPINSGKSTTLFSLLSALSTPNVNLSTLEDPVEYRIKGANQVQLNSSSGVSFASGLKAIISQDSNIIMVGELSDGITAKLAVKAANSGHLVFSTLFAADAPSSLVQLVDMGVESFLVASTLRAVVGQRLVRRLCVNCRETFVPDSAILQKVVRAFDINGRGGISRIHELEAEALVAGLGSNTSTSSSSITRLYRAHKDGCEHCSHTGYKGRLGIYEVLPINSELQKVIVSGARSESINNTAVNEGMIGMQLDGLIKALLGVTTVDEVLKVKA